MKKLALAFAVTALVDGVACGSDPSPSSEAASFCTQLDATRQSVEDLENVDIVADGTTGLLSALSEVVASLDALGDVGTVELSAQIAAVRTAVSSLQTSISSIDPANLEGAAAEIGPELSALGTAVRSLVDAAGQCG